MVISGEVSFSWLPFFLNAPFSSFLKWFISVYVKFLSSKRVIKILRFAEKLFNNPSDKMRPLRYMSRAWRGLLEHIPSSFQREYSASIHAGSGYITNFAKLFFFVWKSWDCGHLRVLAMWALTKAENPCFKRTRFASHSPQKERICVQYCFKLVITYFTV